MIHTVTDEHKGRTALSNIFDAQFVILWNIKKIYVNAFCV